jgi:hypothetical protein
MDALTGLPTFHRRPTALVGADGGPTLTAALKPVELLLF